MTLPELPALLRFNLNRGVIREHEHGTLCWYGQHAERESILVAEIERLRAHADAFAEVMACIHGDGGHYLAEHGTAKAAEDAAAKVSALRAEVKAMRADAERYRWLRDNSAGQWEHPIVVTQRRQGRRMQYVGPLVFRELDAAIDAARGAP